MIFRLSLKLAKKAKIALPDVLPAAASPLLDWSANVFMVGRVQYILLTNTASLYSAILPGRGVSSAGDLIEDAFTAIGQRMCRDGWTEAYRRCVLPVRAAVAPGRPVFQGAESVSNGIDDRHYLRREGLPFRKRDVAGGNRAKIEQRATVGDRVSRWRRGDGGDG